MNIDGIVFGRQHRILVDPTPQPRHRSNGNHLFDPSGRAKQAIRNKLRIYLQHLGISQEMFPLTTSYVSIEVTFLIRRPNSHFISGSRRNGILPEFLYSMPTTTGDLDNYVKFILDVIDGIFFGNDRDVVQLIAKKFYTDTTMGQTMFIVNPYRMEIIDLT
jgi:Holliday junction resolvase RusA-like endonuclease